MLGYWRWLSGADGGQREDGRALLSGNERLSPCWTSKVFERKLMSKCVRVFISAKRMKACPNDPGGTHHVHVICAATKDVLPLCSLFGTCSLSNVM